MVSFEVKSKSFLHSEKHIKQKREQEFLLKHYGHFVLFSWVDAWFCPQVQLLMISICPLILGSHTLILIREQVGK